MTDWPGDLIRQGVVERVDPDPQTARLWLLAAARHLEGAAQIAGVDPTGAYTLSTTELARHSQQRCWWRDSGSDRFRERTGLSPNTRRDSRPAPRSSVISDASTRFGETETGPNTALGSSGLQKSLAISITRPESSSSSEGESRLDLPFPLAQTRP